MNIPIWNGSSNFTIGSTPFGYYDNDPQFQSDADRVAKFCTTRLGYPVMEVELQADQIYALFEEAITEYGNQVFQYKIRENFLTLQGNSTGSGPYNNQLITPNLGFTIKVSEGYGVAANVGGSVPYYTGSVDLVPYQQVYDLNVWAQQSASLEVGDSIEIERVFYEASPAIVRYFDPYAGTGTGIQSLMETFGFGQYSPGINFMLMPVFYDVLKIQAIEFNDQIRKSSFSFELNNNNIRIFPVPTVNGKLHFHYIKKSERSNPVYGAANGNAPDNLITNISNVPYENPVYSRINAVGRQWVFQYTLALAKELLGYIRGKYTTVPIPGADVTLNQNDLITAGTAEKNALLEQLRGTLEETSRKALLERQKLEADSLRDTLNSVPLTIYVF